jgi:hypothetical protein
MGMLRKYRTELKEGGTERIGLVAHCRIKPSVFVVEHHLWLLKRGIKISLERSEDGEGVKEAY